jgi:hypothetical protein
MRFMGRGRAIRPGPRVSPETTSNNRHAASRPLTIPQRDCCVCLAPGNHSFTNLGARNSPHPLRGPRFGTHA